MDDGGVTGRPPAARLLDLTRLVSRIGRGPLTGVDRVEAAYLAALLARADPLYSLVRTASAYSLLDRAGTEALAGRLQGAVPWGAPDWRAQLRRKATPEKRAAEADLRRLALARSSHRQLAAMLAAELPPGTAWLNTGHTNLSEAMFRAVHALPGRRASVLVHDMIPLDHPDWQRPGSVEIFRARMQAVANGADLVICTSEAVRADATRHFTAMGRVPPMRTAHLGVDVPAPQPEALPPGLDLHRPYFVALGTIEPRKNHAFLLDLWEHLATVFGPDEMPALFIVGQRGWANEAVFARLDTAAAMGRDVFELSGLGDGAVAALVEGARALLMPSLAEGFGLPPAEALALGTKVIANDLPVYRETLGNNPIYAKVSDMYSWSEAVTGLARAEKTDRKAEVGAAGMLPTWQEHFNLVLKVT
jgi:glycosyltransferase involved in cell wall biosynthesis